MRCATAVSKSLCESCLKYLVVFPQPRGCSEIKHVQFREKKKTIQATGK